MASTLLAVLGWSTSQGDAALDGARSVEAGLGVGACPWPTSSALAYPWRAGWIATAAELAAPPSLREARAQGHVGVVRLAHGSAATLGVQVWAADLTSS